MKDKLIRYLSNFPTAKLLNPSGKQQTVVIDFSSPNIAKPFHLGHFRATITGNFVRNINEAAGHRVIAVNYLGDYGSQFDILADGWTKYGSLDELRTDPLRYLNQIYVRANVDHKLKLEMAKTSPASTTMDTESKEKLRAMVKRLTMEQLKKTYARMHIRFDQYEYESDYADAAQEVTNVLVEHGLAFPIGADGMAKVIPFGVLSPSSPDIVLIKADGTSLYLTRDIAAAISRYNRYHFDRIHYVVEGAQHMHFNNLRSVLQRLRYPWAINNASNAAADASRSPLHDSWHIPFGRIESQSSRRGDCLILEDILDNAKQYTRLRMLRSPNTHHFDSEATASLLADQLGLSSLIVEVFRYSRTKPLRKSALLGYSVSPAEADCTNGVELLGIRLQYTHARLCSVERKILEKKQMTSSALHDHLIFQLELNPLPPVKTQSHRVFVDLVQHLEKFEETLRMAYLNYEPREIVHYLLRLSALVNVAWKLLPVDTCNSPVERAWNLSLFLASRNVLSLSFRLLGIEPLERF